MGSLFNATLFEGTDTFATVGCKKEPLRCPCFTVEEIAHTHARCGSYSEPGYSSTGYAACSEQTCDFDECSYIDHANAYYDEMEPGGTLISCYFRSLALNVQRSMVISEAQFEDCKTKLLEAMNDGSIVCEGE